eukprot:TRINITY_DN1810_c0_g1_i3.p1 TRINITY_DN1810_c0_g1~~TRINITY_DN1810_c0_g1_i3.p1  ORF type:complete len:650 (+),score=169.65 TRINITY_DN1810_c0_g1_i3:164-1951(+)
MRRNFEYKIRKLKPNKIDFLNYINYCFKIDKVRKERSMELKIEISNEKHKKFHWAIKNKINNLYNFAINRTPSDLSLWVQYIKFNSTSYNRLRGVFLRALRFHSLQPDLWILAATFEFNRGNMMSARMLLQRGLRSNKDSKELWRTYLKMELKYLSILRSEVESGIDLGLAPALKDKSEPLLDADSLPLEIEDDKNKESDISRKIRHQERIAEQLDTPFLQGSVPKVIFAHAILEFPKDVKFRVGLANSFERYRFMDSFVDEIYSQLLADHERVAEAVTAVCLRPWKRCSKKVEKDKNVAEAEAEAGAEVGKKRKRQEEELHANTLFEAALSTIDLFEQHVKTLPTPEMWDNYILFLWQVQSLESFSQRAAVLEQKLEDVFSRAEKENGLTENSFKKWLKFLAIQKREEESLALAEKGHQRFPQSRKLLVQWLDLLADQFLVESLISCDKPLARYEAVLKEVSRLLNKDVDYPQDNLLIVWQRYLAFCFSLPQLTFQQIFLLLKRLADDIRLKNRGVVLRQQLKPVMLRFGLDQARLFYNTVLDKPHLLEAFLKDCLALEDIVPKPDVERIRRLFVIGTTNFGRTSTGDDLIFPC